VGQASDIVKILIPNILDNIDLKPSQFIHKNWQEYKNKYSSNVSINGRVFELLIAATLVRSNILPFYMQAKLAFIPNVNYDFIIYSQQNGPICLSAKTSLRERWKQADLEAVAMRYIHRNALSYVISLNEREVKARKRDLNSVMAINDFILATSEDYDRLLENLATLQLNLAPVLPIVESRKIIIESQDWEQKIHILDPTE
jgi:hypothetical protein